MSLSARARSLFAFLFRRQRLEEELDEEVRSCFDMLVDRCTECGMPPAAARFDRTFVAWRPSCLRGGHYQPPGLGSNR